MNNIFGINYFIFCFIVLAIVLYFTKEIRDEGFFGMSPGTLDQLRSTSVPSNLPLTNAHSTDIPACPSTSTKNPMSTPLQDLIQDNLQKKGIMDMTEPANQPLGFYALV
jgi:hypothetical protein